MKKVTSAARLAEAYERLDAAAGKPGGALRRVGKTLSEPWLMTQLTLLLCLNLLHGLQQSTTGLLRYAVAGVLAHAVFSSTDAVSVFAENHAPAPAAHPHRAAASPPPPAPPAAAARRRRTSAARRAAPSLGRPPTAPRRVTRRTRRAARRWPPPRAHAPLPPPSRST